MEVTMVGCPAGDPRERIRNECLFAAQIKPRKTVLRLVSPRVLWRGRRGGDINLNLSVKSYDLPNILLQYR